MGYILVVEDDCAVREMMKLTLEMYGLTAKGAKDVKEATMYIMRDRPDLIILDYILGMDMCDPIIDLAKEMIPTTPIIMCSAWNKIEEIASNRGIPYVLKKPFAIESLGELLEKILPGAFTENKVS